MKRDIKYIIKRIIIGVGIALLLGFLKTNVYAYEWEVTDDVYIENNNIIPLDVSTISAYSRNTPSYPFTRDSSYKSYSLNVSSSCGGADGGFSTFTSSSYGGQYYNNFIYYFNTPFVLDEGTYYVILPLGYDDDTSMVDFHYNDNLLLDSTIYSTNNPDINITSVTFSVGSNNPFDCSDTFVFPKLMYFKVAFEVLNQTNGFTLYLGEDTSRSATFTAYNTTNYNQYLYYFTSPTYNSSYRYYYKFYKPLFYSHNVGSIFPDYSSITEDTLSNINDDITTNIINGVYTGNSVLDGIGSGGGGGISFGNNNISDILTIPLTFLQKLNSSTTCQPVEIPLPVLNGNFTLPCMSSFFEEVMGSNLFGIIQLILGVGIGFKVGMSFYYTILHILDPQKMITN